jgi:Protein of unknown function (DUF3617)
MTSKFSLAHASLFLSAVLATGVAAASNTAFKPGLWEIKRVVTGGPRNQGPQTDRYCITEAQLRADPGAPLKLQPTARQGQKAPQCNMGPANIADGKASVSATCKGPMGSMKASWTGTYDATSFDMSGKMKMGFMSAKMSSTGRHLGACQAK